MKILITGATGLVGVNLVQKLAESDHGLRILTRVHSNTKAIDHLNLERVIGNVSDYESVRRAVDGCEIVFHLAGRVDMNPFNREKVECVNILGTENVIKACLDAKVQRLIHTSSIAAVGYGNRTAPANEKSAWNFRSLHHPYYDSKRAGELRVLEAVKKKGLDATILNPAFILGPWDVKPSSGAFVIMLAKYPIPFYPTGGISVAHVESVVQGHLAALEKGRAGERYILAGDNISYRRLMSFVAELSEHTPPFIPLLRPATIPMGLLGDVLGRAWPNFFQRLNSKMLKSGSIDHCVSSDKARKELDYRPLSAQRAVEDAYKWFRDYGYLNGKRRI
jgi:dihydroflavonol-4-reductase